MVEIGGTIISRDIFEQHFLCDLLKCKGACCVEGDSGAPLTKEEAVNSIDVNGIVKWITNIGAQATMSQLSLESIVGRTRHIANKISFIKQKI